MINELFGNPRLGVKFGITTPNNKNYVYRFRYVKKLDMWFAHQVRSKDSVYLGQVKRLPYPEIHLTAKSRRKLSDDPVIILNGILHELAHGGTLPKGFSIYLK